MLGIYFTFIKIYGLFLSRGDNIYCFFCKLSKENPVVYVIVKNKKLSDLKDVNYKIIQKGERYSLLNDLKKK